VPVALRAEGFCASMGYSQAQESGIEGGFRYFRVLKVSGILGF
jgi:hypothetical protein